MNEAEGKGEIEEQKERGAGRAGSYHLRFIASRIYLDLEVAGSWDQCCRYC